MPYEKGFLGTTWTVFPSHNNVRTVFDAANELRLERGLRWYENEHHYARALADTHWRPGSPRTVATACGVLAVLSPMVGWEYAKQLALDLYRRPSQAGGTYKANIDKALRIYRGEPPEQVVSGPKTTAFYHALLTAGRDPNVVVVDRHAAHAAVGGILADRERARLLKERVSFSGYDAVATAYRAATKAINTDLGTRYTPSQVQAVVWVTWRDTLLGEGGEVS